MGVAAMIGDALMVIVVGCVAIALAVDLAALVGWLAEAMAMTD